MFRTAPNHALYQGDVIVVPMLFSKDRDPIIVTEATREELGLCRRCGARFADEYAPRQARRCPGCAATEKVPRSEKRFTLISSRVNDGEDLFGARSERGSRTERTIATIDAVYAMVLSHSCDVDNADYIRFAPMRPINRFDPDEAAEIRRGDYVSYVYLGPTDEREEGIVDLDHQFNLSHALLGERHSFQSRAKGRRENALMPYREATASRVVSLDEDGLRYLYSRIILHLVRPGRASIDADPSEDALADDPDRPKDLPVHGWWWPYRPWPKGAKQKALDL